MVTAAESLFESNYSDSDFHKNSKKNYYKLDENGDYYVFAYSNSGAKPIEAEEVEFLPKKIILNTPTTKHYICLYLILLKTKTGSRI